MTETSLDTPRSIRAFAAVVEVGTGLVLMIDPAIVVSLLLGMEVSGAGTLLGRCFGIALLVLGLACWPSRQRTASGSPAFRAMLIYNVLIALYLAYLGTMGHLGGLLLWPGVTLHAVVALLLIWTWRQQRRTRSGGGELNRTTRHWFTGVCHQWQNPPCPPLSKGGAPCAGGFVPAENVYESCVV